MKVRQSRGQSALGLARSTVLAGLVVTGTQLALADGTPDQLVYQSPGLRIYRTVDRNGYPTLVLTNLDQQGTLLDPVGEASECPPVDASRPEEQSVPTEPPRSPRTGIQVVINSGSGGDPSSPGDVTVRDDESGGATVVVNINTSPAPPSDESPLFAPFYQVLASSGFIGAFRYPDHLPFLGYGTGASFPSFFSGLGMEPRPRFHLRADHAGGHR
jgi:hypothetical protein